ncbi:MAG TPA: DUF4190 domain-containing protein [Mycobacterium sp.]|jgi:hypothetical protein|uniref:DUF4190 domain-containing protein n=1 Tax=Mycobacterium sp. TaxID=1785 RepID=UPI002F3FF6E5
MTAQGGDHGEEYRAHPNQPRPWERYPHPPVDPYAPVNYPEYPPQPQQQPPPPYGPTGYGGPPPPPYTGPIGAGGFGGPPPMYPGPYDPYQGYPSQDTNGLAVASLVTSIAGVVIGIPLAIFCYVGWLIPVVGAVLGGIALNQIKQRGQQGRGLAIAGIAIGSATAALLVLVMVIVAAAAFHSPMFVR